MIRARHALIPATLVALLVAATGPADAYWMIQTGTTGRVTAGGSVSCWASGGFAHWSQADYEDIRWRLNTSGQGSGKASAVQAAAAAWTNVPSADHRLVYDGTTSAGWATDGQNTVLFANSNDCTGSCLAVTALVMQ